MTTVLVTGATGFLGEHVVRRLLGSGSDILAFVRPGSRTGWLRQHAVGLRAGDLSERTALQRALRDVDVFLNIASLGSGHAANIVAAAEVAGVGRAVFVSSTSVFTQLPTASKPVRIQAERLITESGLDYTILRPTMIYGTPRDRNIWRLINHLRRWPVIPVVGRGDALQQPVFVEDVATAVVRAAGADYAIGNAYNLAGAAPLSFVQIIDTVCAALGRRVVKIHLPPRLARSAAVVSSRFGLRVSAEQVARIEEDKAFDISAASADLRFQPLDFERGVARELQWLDRM
jgi:nucleoside-diphosphate-sugar epimerase